MMKFQQDLDEQYEESIEFAGQKLSSTKSRLGYVDLSVPLLQICKANFQTSFAHYLVLSAVSDGQKSFTVLAPEQQRRDVR